MEKPLFNSGQTASRWGGFFLLAGLMALLLLWQWRVNAAPVQAESASTIYLPLAANFGVPQVVTAVPFAAGFNTATVTDIANAGTDRLYVVTREGYVRIVEPNGTVLPTPFLNISPRVAIDNWEQGLLGLAFHPNYPETPYIYVTYTRKTSYKIYVSRFTMNPATPDVIDGSEANELVLMQLNKTPENNHVSPVHNGGDLAFGPDGYLYIGFGDGGPDPHYGGTEPHDPANHSQRTDVLLGKIIRIDVNSTRPGNLPPDCGRYSTVNNYSIPPGNPYVGETGCDEIWALGLRNPWRFSFDSATGDMYIGDVGEWIFEEVDFIPAGESDVNFGWRCWEGTFDQTLPGVGHPDYAVNCLPFSAYEPPIFEYASDNGETLDCAVTGGFVYRGQDYPALQGYYLFADFCSGRLWITQQVNGAWDTHLVGDLPFTVSTFGEGVDGELYVGSYGVSTIFKVVLP